MFSTKYLLHKASYVVCLEFVILDTKLQDRAGEL